MSALDWGAVAVNEQCAGCERGGDHDLRCEFIPADGGPSIWYRLCARCERELCAGERRRDALLLTVELRLAPGEGRA